VCFSLAGQKRCQTKGAKRAGEDLARWGSRKRTKNKKTANFRKRLQRGTQKKPLREQHRNPSCFLCRQLNPNMQVLAGKYQLMEQIGHGAYSVVWYVFAGLARIQ
jgi:hypothetical protein